jgi:hypothetical protein
MDTEDNNLRWTAVPVHVTLRWSGKTQTHEWTAERATHEHMTFVRFADPTSTYGAQLQHHISFGSYLRPSPPSYAA